MSEYNLDIAILEELCSELNEGALLIGKDKIIHWLNIFMKDKISSINSSKKTNASLDITPLKEGAFLKEFLFRVYGYNYNDELDNMKISKAFDEGKFLKGESTNNGITLKYLCIPIKLDLETKYVLLIIENVRGPKLEPIIKHFINGYKEAVIVSDVNSDAVLANEKFKTVFDKAPIIQNLITNTIRESNGQNVAKELSEIVALSHIVKAEKLNDKHAGMMYRFLRK